MLRLDRIDGSSRAFEHGEQVVLEDNAFIERVLGDSIRKLTNEEMAVYRAPFSTPESRNPTWRFPNELPIAGKPAVYATIEHAHMLAPLQGLRRRRETRRPHRVAASPDHGRQCLFGAGFSKRTAGVSKSIAGMIG